MVQDWKSLIVGAFAAFGVWSASVAAANPDRWIQNTVLANGSAEFLLVHGETKQVLWTVSCTTWMKSCVARGHGLVLWVDSHGDVHLRGAAAPGSRVAVVRGNRSQDWPLLFRDPLDADAIAVLSRPDAHIVIQERDHVAHVARTEGLSRVVDYLRWLSSTEAILLRDARHWARGRLAFSRGRRRLHSDTIVRPQRRQFDRKRRSFQQRSHRPNSQ